jgi:hypothetical protein
MQTKELIESLDDDKPIVGIKALQVKLAILEHSYTALSDMFGNVPKELLRDYKRIQFLQEIARNKNMFGPSYVRQKLLTFLNHPTFIDEIVEIQEIEML